MVHGSFQNKSSYLTLGYCVPTLEADIRGLGLEIPGPNYTKRSRGTQFSKLVG